MKKLGEQGIKEGEEMNKSDTFLPPVLRMQRIFFPPVGANLCVRSTSGATTPNFPFALVGPLGRVMDPKNWTQPLGVG